MHDTDYFKDEVRNGFYIPTAIKQAWAAELDVLRAVDELCEKHGILYYADWGTLLGTVRHGGFVPWDDDLDICMRRSDYERFKALAAKELPANFRIFNYANHDDHWLFITRVVNTERICYEEHHLNEYHNFPFIAGLDIFLLDYLYKDPAEEKKRCDEVMRILSIADAIVEGILSGNAAAAQVAELCTKYGTVIDAKADPVTVGRSLYALAETQMARVKEEDADELGQIFPWIIKGRKGYDKRAYERTIHLPFEDRQISVPFAYAEMLRRRYGDYFTIKKVWSGHDYPFFEGQRRAMQEVSSEPLPEFCFEEGMLERVPEDKENSLCAVFFSWCESLKELDEELALSDTDGVLERLAEAQELAVDLGTLAEETYGEEGAADITALLQAYCDRLYSLYNETAAGEKSPSEVYAEAEEALAEIKNYTQNVLAKRREVLFVTTGAAEWKSFAPIYEELKDSYSVSVVALPLFEKDALGRLKEEHHTDPLKGLPKDLPLADWDKYSPMLRHPEKIYIQFPYDGENPCLGIPRSYLSTELKPCCGELVYVQPFVTGDFSAEDKPDIYNMKHYVTAPAVIGSDKIYVPSENMRQRYIEKLTDFAGGDTKAYWESRVLVNTWPEAAAAKKEKKRVLFCIGLNELTEMGDAFFGALEGRLGLFKENSEKLDMEIILYPPDKKAWLAAEPERAVRFFEETGDIKMAADRDQDAYYGSPSPYVLEFSQSKRPVMIADFKLDT